jgi:hypothetical protein
VAGVLKITKVMSLRICAIHHVEHSLVYAVNDKRHKIYNRKIIILNLTMAKIRKNFDVSSNPQYLVNPVFIHGARNIIVLNFLLTSNNLSD